MVIYPIKRVFGLIGSPRAGKDEVANFLTETRGFKRLAFADKIKEECGISIQDFEMAKINGNISQIRQKLWDYSSNIRKTDPTYFIRLIIEEATKIDNSVVITDIRTYDEIKAVENIGSIYWVINTIECNIDDDGMIKGSKLHYDTNIKQAKIKRIENQFDGIFNFYKYLEQYFYKEDIMDLIGPIDSSDCDEHKQKIHNLRTMMSNYISQFEVKPK